MTCGWKIPLVHCLHWDLEALRLWPRPVNSYCLLVNQVSCPIDNQNFIASVIISALPTLDVNAALNPDLCTDSDLYWLSLKSESSLNTSLNHGITIHGISLTCDSLSPVMPWRLRLLVQWGPIKGSSIQIVKQLSSYSQILKYKINNHSFFLQIHGYIEFKITFCPHYFEKVFYRVFLHTLFCLFCVWKFSHQWKFISTYLKFCNLYAFHQATMHRFFQ